MQKSTSMHLLARLKAVCVEQEDIYSCSIFYEVAIVAVAKRFSTTLQSIAFTKALI